MRRTLRGTNGNDNLSVDSTVKKNMTLYGYDGNDSLRGSQGKDKLWGGAGDDQLYGFQNNDKLYGGDGDDTMDGGSGNDRLLGGLGHDLMTGGTGRDTFVYKSTTESILSTLDIITDFVVNDDIIDLSGIDAKVGVAGNNTFHEVFYFAGNQGELVITADTGKTIIEADTNGDMKADFAILLFGHHDFLAHNLIL